MIDLIQQGLQDDTCPGLISVMGVGRRQAFTPLYVGKAERRGKTLTVSRNNPSTFVWWGYGLDYHEGDLSLDMFGFSAYREPARKYCCWAEALFASMTPPVLSQPVQMLLPWSRESRERSGLMGSVAFAEKEVIALASVFHTDTLLNVDGR